MSLRSFFRSSTRAATAAALASAGASASAADVYAPPVAPGAVAPAMPACESCQHGAPKGNCSTCGNKLLGNHRDKGPYPVTLCPGACFGYFQTQWRKWDEVCPYPVSYTHLRAHET